MQKICLNQRKSGSRNSGKSNEDSIDLHPMLIPSRRSSRHKFNDQNIYDVIIIGAGISGLLAADILLREQKSVLVLQSKNECGGSIKQQKVGQMMKQNELPDWIKNNELVRNTKVEIGTSQLMSDHTYMIKICEQLDLTLTPMYSDGKIIYAESQTSIKTVLSMMQIYFCTQYKKTISKLLAKIENISKNILQAHQKIINNPGKAHYLQVLKEYVERFDNMTVREFFQKQLQDENLRNMVINEFEIVESIEVQKVSMFHVFLHEYGLENLKYFTQMKSYLTQNLRIKEGNLELTSRLKNKIEKKQKKMGLDEDVLKFNEQVIEIKNQINSEVQVITNRGSYKCFKVFFSATMDSVNKVKISKLSNTKRLVLDNQLEGNLQRTFLLFQTAFWRSKFSGRGVFSKQLPVSEMIDFSPSNLSCGILCLVICGSKTQKWKEKFSGFKNSAEQKAAQLKYLKNFVSKMFLNGNTDSLYLKSMQIFIADSDNYCYQTFTKTGIAHQLQSQGEDYLECYIRDEHNIIFLGSQLSKKYGSFMEGAVRHTREQIYRYLQIEDPWGKL